MAKKKTSPYIVLNPPFDGRLRYIGPPENHKLTRGFLAHAPLTKGDKKGGVKRGRINFLFNPTTITVNHSIDPAQIDETGQPKEMANIDSKGNFVGIGDVSFDLLFDRTFELWDSSKKNTLAGKLGAYADVIAFYHFIGLTDPQTNTTAVTGGFSGLLDHLINPNSTTETFAASYPISPARPTLCYVYIGTNLKYYGQISGLTVQYTHWNRDMIPTRAAISFGLQLQADPNKNYSKISSDNLYTAGATSTDLSSDDDPVTVGNYGTFDGLGGDD